MVKGKVERPESASVQLVLAKLRALGLSKSDFAKRLSLSPDYVYRILGGRSPFPRTRELLERMATLCELDPYAFAEYRARDEALPVSTRVVWERMRERGMSREDLFNAMDGRISRPYFNSILRGDQPFPTTRAFVQLFALALDLPPAAFPEFGPKSAPRRTPEQVEELEERVFEFFFDVMMAEGGFAPHPLALGFLDPARVRAFFLAPAQLDASLTAILTRMGELGMGFPELLRVSGVPRGRLAALFSSAAAAKAHPEDVAAVRRALRIE